MNKLICTAMMTASLLSSVSAAPNSDVGKFSTCRNVNGAGLYMINSTTGELFLLNLEKKDMIPQGKPKAAKLGAVGTYALSENHNGAGVYISNTTTGETWWTNGVEWEAFGQANDRKK